MAFRALPLVLALGLAFGQDAARAEEFSGELRIDVIGSQAAGRGPIAQANTLAPGIATQPGWTAAPQVELRGGLGPFHAVATLGHRFSDHGAEHGWARFNELYASGGQGAWQLTGGRRIVSWDVGEGFRPNDVVQQEPRRPLVQVLPVGRTVLMADYFGADTAATVLLVNPENGRSARGPEEPALAGRFYMRNGAADWHGFARWGRRTGGSLGAAVAWVATDALEVHASARYMAEADTLAVQPTPTVLVTANPWQPATVRRPTQALVGARWVGESKQSLLLEAWWDGTAPSRAQWDA
ncbi:hypothetical protein, partial [Ramlibacter sp.]|uniref:hypothetical protein n=1 Tax=Ramlibacter sp. TaxID=1917967 RepID=UPI00181A0F3A